MNKKAYITPFLSEEKVALNHTVLTVSDPNIGINNSDNVNPEDIDVKVENDWNIWDEAE